MTSLRIFFGVLVALSATTTASTAQAKNPRVLQIGATAGGQGAYEFTALGSGVAFYSPSGNAVALYTSDGTVAGTMAYGLIAGTGNVLGSATFLGSDGGLAVVADQTDRLWKTGGTFASTSAIGPGLGDAYPGVFLGNVLVHGLVPKTGVPTSTELARTDGTAAGTFKIPSAKKKIPWRWVVDASGIDFISETGAVFHTDGSTATQVAATPLSTRTIARCGGVLFVGTSTQLLRIGAGGALQVLADSVEGDDLACAGSKAVFRGYTSASGGELWASDGTAGGTTKIAEIAAGANSGISESQWRNMRREVGGRVFFSADDGSSGVEPWVTDGTAAGTTRVGDLAAGTLSSTPEVLGVVNGTVYFLATGTNGGRGLYSLASGATSAQFITSNLISIPSSLTSVVSGSKIFASADNRLWVFDPSAPVDPGAGAPDLVPYVAPPTLSPASGGGATDGGATDGGSVVGSDGGSSSGSSGSSGSSSGASSGSSGTSGSSGESSDEVTPTGDGSGGADASTSGCQAAHGTTSAAGTMATLVVLVAGLGRRRRGSQRNRHYER
jgi:uncharacterized protein (TIGR03382 family)